VSKDERLFGQGRLARAKSAVLGDKVWRAREYQGIVERGCEFEVGCSVDKEDSSSFDFLLSFEVK
jgi:hypothetical protein